MKKHSILLLPLAFLFFIAGIATAQESRNLMLGADRMDAVTEIVKGKRVGLVLNQTSILTNGVHLLDTLLAKGIAVKKVFAPEHGFRGTFRRRNSGELATGFEKI